MKNTIITSTDAWRLFRYLGKRIYRRTEMDGIARAVELGILGRDKISVRGTQLVRFSPGPLAVGRSQAELQRLIAQANLRTVQDHRSRRDVSSSFFAREHDDANVEHKTVAWDEVTCDLLALVRAAASPVRTVDVAVAALVAQALLRSSISLAELLRVLAKPAPILTLIGEVMGFQKAFIRLLGEGTLLPEKSHFAMGTILSRKASKRISTARRTLAGTWFCLREAILTNCPTTTPKRAS